MCKEKTKKCHRCGKELPATTEYFWKASDKKDGLNIFCKDCSRSKAPMPDVLVLNGMKYCQRCNRVLPANNMYFDKHGKTKDGLERTCRECKGLRFYDSKTWICPACGKELPFTEEYWKPNKAESSGWTTSMCRACFNEYYRDYCHDNPEWRREKERKYKEKNPEKAFAKAKRHHDKEKLEGKTKYCNQNKLKARDRRRKRVVRLLNAQGSHDSELFKQKLEYHGYRCYYCGKELTIDTATEDHRIPLSRGGTDWISNIVPACGSCNSSKGPKTETEYWEYLKKIESYREDGSLFI